MENLHHLGAAMARKGRPPLKRQRLLDAAQERDSRSSDEEFWQADTEPEDDDLGAADMPSMLLANVEDAAAGLVCQPSVQSLPIGSEEQAGPPGTGFEAGRVLLLFDVTSKQLSRLAHHCSACLHGCCVQRPNPRAAICALMQRIASGACSCLIQGCCLHCRGARQMIWCI